MSISVSFPSGKIFAKQNNAVTVTRTAAEDSLKFTLQYGDISITRTFNASASLPATLIFPVDSLFEMIVGDSPTKTINTDELSVSWEIDTEYNTEIIVLVNGASAYAIEALPTTPVPASPETILFNPGFPQPKKIPIYQSFLPTNVPAAIKSNQSYLCVIGADYYAETPEENALLFAQLDLSDVGKIYYYLQFWKIFDVGGGIDLEDTQERKILSYSLVNGNTAELTESMIEKLNEHTENMLVLRKSVLQSDTSNYVFDYVTDECSARNDEVFLRWFDIYGYTLHYKFKRKELMNDFKITDTLKSFDASLVEYKKQKKTYDKTYTLSSNLVDADTFDWLKRIGIGRNVELFDGTTWVKALVGEVSISGQDEQNTVMFKVTTEELVPTL